MLKKNKIPLSQLLEPSYINPLLTEELPKYYPQFKSLEKLRIYTIKKHFQEEFEHCVSHYSFLIIDNDNRYRRLNVYCSAHSDGSRKTTFAVLKSIYQNKISDQKPLFFDPNTQGMFYEGVWGQNLLSYIQYQIEINHWLDPIAKKIAKLHQLKGEEIKLTTFKSNLWSLDPSQILKNAPDAEMKQKIIQSLKKIQQEFNRLELKKFQNQLIHGDCHPENIVIGQLDQKISIIDFTEAHLGDFIQDLSSFIQQLNFMSLGFYTTKKIESQQKLFLDYYWRAQKIKPNQNIINRFYFYQAWQALRSAVFFLKSNKEKDVNLLNRQTQDFLKQIKK